MTVTQTDQITVCGICGHPLVAEQLLLSCPACERPFHRECWEELGGCATFGCSRMVETKKPDEQINYWGASKKQCPMCAESIPVSALECPCCHTNFDDIRPMAKTDLVKPVEDDNVRAMRRRAAWLLFFNAIGITSPIAVVVALLWYLRGKQEIARADPSSRALILISITIGLIYLFFLPLAWVIFKLRSVT